MPRASPGGQGAAASLTASLSEAFKREFGVSPGAYRRSTGRLGA
jgi:hypothetical protein